MVRGTALVTQPLDVDTRLRPFGRTDLNVSEFGLGCARVGGIFQQDTADFLKLFSAALDAGINFFDTADIYSQGESEVLLGRAFRRRRDQVVIASKAGFVLPAQRRLVARLKPFVRPLLGLIRLGRHHLPDAVRGTPAQNFSPSHLRHAVEGSLRRLGTDRLDLFQLHSPPASVVDGADWLEALDQLKQEGKIRYYGISCDTVDAASAALRHSRVSSIQLPINLLERDFVDVLPRAREQGVAVIARECLANGLLVKEASAIDVEAYCHSRADAALKTARLESCRQTAVENGCTLATLALKFVSRLDGVSVSLIGVSRLRQLEGLLAGGITSANQSELRGIPRWA
jgi:aryl-alcohol dehydrogenase-like predicted oxidoreductase